MSVCLDLVAPPELIAGALHAGLRSGDPESGSTIVNLRRLQHIDPAGLVALALFSEQQSENGRVPRFFAPTESRSSRYLQRLRLGEVVESLGGDHDLPVVEESFVERPLIPLQRFDGVEEVTALAALVAAALPEHSAGGVVHKAMCEIGVNVPEHSGREHGYIAAVVDRDRSSVRFAIGDAGVGLLEPLQAQGYSSALEVIEQLLLHPGLTRFDEAGRGRGVFRTKQVIMECGGTLYVASGPAAVLVTLDGLDRAEPAIALPGTLLQGEVRW